jgi:hypothetical protein
VDAQQVLAFRLARSGLAGPRASTLIEAAACPASDFARDAALLALAARHEALTRERYEEAIEEGEVVVACCLRGAVHALAPGDHALFGPSLVSSDDDELAAQLGRQVQRLAKEKGFAPTAALDEVAEATKAALRERGALDKNELHAELRRRVSEDLQPWCKGCKSHHVAPMLWRYGGVKAGVKLDAHRRYVPATPGASPPAADALIRFLHFYGPGDAGGFAEWAGIAKSHAARLWQQVEDDLSEVSVGKKRGMALRRDLPDLESPPEATGVRLIPPGDPYLQKPNRALLTRDEGLRKKLFRPVASPGAILKDGKLVGSWRVKAKGSRSQITVESFGRIALEDLKSEAQRVATLRGSGEFELVIEG